MKDRVAKLYREKPEYIPVLKACCEAHRRVKREFESLEGRKLGDSGWPGFEWSEVNLDTDDFNTAMKLPRMLSDLSKMGILSARGSRRRADYKVNQISKVEQALREAEEFEEKSREEALTPPSAEEIPDDLFSTIAGYDDVKDLFRRSLRTSKFHILLIGPPASAKTLFLLELARLPNSFYCLGSSTSKAGLAEVLQTQRPKHLMVDEIDKIANMDLAVLLSLMETGIVRETKVSKMRDVVLNTSVFAAANTDAGLAPELKSRFRILYLPPYTEKQFKDAVVRVLGGGHLAEHIAERSWEVSRDVREAVRMGRICFTREEVDEDIRLMKRYGRKAWTQGR